MIIKIPMLGLTPHGGNRVLIELANNLAIKGNEVEIIIPRGRINNPYPLNSKVKIKEIGFSLVPKKLSYLIFLSLVFFYLRNSIIIANYFLTVIPSFFAKVFLNSKYIYLVQDIEYRFFKGFLRPFFKQICHWTYNRGSIVVANDYLYEQISKKWKVLYRINIGPSEEFFNSPQNNIQKNYDIIYFLRNEKHKRLDRFLGFLKNLDQNISIACVSQDKELLRNFQHPAIHPFTPKNDKELVDLFDQSKVLLLTSDHEGFSLPPLEGMARGVPPLLFECGGPSTYCNNGENCVYLKEDGPKTIQKEILKLIQNPELYRHLSLNSKLTSQKFNLKNGIENLTGFLKTHFEDRIIQDCKSPSY